MMTKEQFVMEIKDRVQKGLGEGYEVSVQQVTKNNGVQLTGLMANDPAKSIAPTIYLDSMYEEVLNGKKDVDEAASDAINSLKKGMPKEKIDMEFFKEYEQVKDKICFRLVNADANRELLNVVPHEEFKDLAVTFFYPFEHDEIGKGSILICNEHMERWGVTEKELMEAAMVNTPKIFPPRCLPLEDVLFQMITQAPTIETDVPARPLQEDAFPMHVLTNGDRTYGASVIMYDNYLAKVAKAAGCDLYILPSSVHECIILPKNGDMKGETLLDMVKEVNETQVDAQERLSYNVYEYDRNTHALSTYEGQGHEPSQGPTLCM